ncbi:MAG TPA: hypothetical protein VFE98_09730 [Candidatus Bathyarchaeia archaeon]|nr:hypothetical protein [Candidatus Bathyarchaeia archaeon]
MVIVMVLAFVASLGFSALLQRSSNPGTTTTSSVSTVCTIMAEGEIIMQVLNSESGKPIGGVLVRSQFLPPECPPNPHNTVTLNTTMTNGAGFVILGGEVGEYYLSVDGNGYPGVTLSILPERATCVTLNIPSGETRITYSATFQFSC